MEQFKKILRNIPLGNKILAIFLLGILPLALAVFISFIIMIRSTNQALYETSAELLSYSSKDISNNLNTIERMADYIMADSTVQSVLGEVKDSRTGTPSTNLYSDIHAALDTYYQRYKPSYVDYLRILNDRFTVTSQDLDSHVLPAEMQQDLIQKAREQKGKSLWVTDYADMYGIFLIRTIRRIEYMKLDELGVLIINVNLNKMIGDISNQENHISYTLWGDNRLLYAPGNLKNITFDMFRDIPLSSYSIRPIQKEPYFIVSGIIPATGWTYYCLSSYDGMYTNIRFVQNLLILIVLILAVFCILLTQRLIKSILIHIDVLMDKIKAFGNERFEILAPAYPYEERDDEIGLLHRQFDRMASKITTLVKENYETGLIAKDAQLKALEMQINPHFLFNVLQSINLRAKIMHDPQCSLMTESLGKLLHITLSSKNRDSSLEQEIALVKYYMTIQEIRYEERLSYQIQVPEALYPLYMPKFILQPLVENAIRYSLEEDSELCSIRIRAVREGEMAAITIANSGSQFPSRLLEKLRSEQILPHGFGIGILNVQRRLELTFGQSFSFDFKNEDGFAVVRLSIPFDHHRRKDRYDPITDRR